MFPRSKSEFDSAFIQRYTRDILDDIIYPRTSLVNRTSILFLIVRMVKRNHGEKQVKQDPSRGLSRETDKVGA